MKRLFLLIVAIIASSFSTATHIVGGEMNYTYLGNNEYLIRLDVYFDCQNGSPQAISQDATAFIGVFDGNSRNLISGFPREVSRKGPFRIVKTNYNCIVQAPNACVDQYYYEIKLSLPARTGGYFISFQRCCRNGSITNLTNPGGTGANYWTHIPDPRTLADAKHNNSAKFKELPPNFLCTNTPLKFDHSATDADGDSLVYELFHPFTGGDQNNPRPDNTLSNGLLELPPFSQITFSGAYSANNPINGNPAMNIDRATGYLTLTPTRVGQFVVGILVKEYRNGKLISSTRRDYQFNVQSCQVDVVASFFVPTFLCGYKYKFQNQSFSAQRYHWDFGIPGRTDDTSNQNNPEINFPGPGVYKVRLYAYKNKCMDSFVGSITVVEPKLPKLPADSTICPGGDVRLKSSVVGESYRWSTGDTTASILTKNTGLIWLEVRAKSCAWRDSMFVSIDNSKINASGDTVYCSNSAFIRTLSASSGWKSYQWSTGENSQSINVTKTGIYRVTGLSIYGCLTRDSAEVSQYTPVQVIIDDTTVCPGKSVVFFSQNNLTNPTFTAMWSNSTTGYTLTTSQPGNYWCEVTVGKCSRRDSFSLANYPNEFELGKDLRFCENIDTTLMINLSGASSIRWNREIIGSTFKLTKAGKVTVDLVNQYGCNESDSIDVKLFYNPIVNLGSDTTLCLSENPILDAGTGMRNYLWHDGTNDQFKVAYDSGFYWVRIVSQEGCAGSDTLYLNKRKDLFPSIIWMPNAFTPNADGRNDVYPNNQYKVKGAFYEVKLYNRWGERIAEFNSPEFNWDGNINGNPAPEGVYVYTVFYIGCDNEKRYLYGNFTLLR